ncbi:ABC transporter substrate-binding protein [Paracidovorax anthurii]|nr:ABC transporter substrate-binding protein [Paracidovorax anthurii]
MRYEMRLKCALLAGLWLMAAAQGRAAPGEMVVAGVGQFKDAASTANQIRAGVQIYFDAVNAQGGVQGAKLRLVLKDRGPDAIDSVHKTREVIAEHRPIALVGISGTGPLEAIAKANVLGEASIPLVGARTGAVSLHQPVNPWIFHTRASYAQEVKKICAHLGTVGRRSVAVFHENSAFGAEGLAQAQAEIKALGLRLAGTAAYEYGTSHVKDAVAVLSRATPDAVIAVATSEATAEFYRQMRAAGSSAFIIALSVADGAAVVQRIGAKAAHGLGITQVAPDPASKTSLLVHELQDDHRRFGAPGSVLNIDVVEGYIAAHVLVEGLRRAGANPTPIRLKAALESLQDYRPGGFAVSFSPTSHSGSKYVDIAVVGPAGKLLR